MCSELCHKATADSALWKIDQPFLNSESGQLYELKNGREVIPLGREGGLVGKCTGLCSTGPVSARIQFPKRAHEQNLSACSAALLLKVLVLYVTVYGYLQEKDHLRPSDKSRGYTRFQASFSFHISKYAKRGTLI